MDLLAKTSRLVSQLGLVIANHMAATAHCRAIASLNDFQLSRLGGGRRNLAF